MSLKKILTKPLWGIPSGPSSDYSELSLVVSEVDPYSIKIANREKSKLSQTSESEYFTVTYQVSLTRKWKRMLLQTYLDSIIRRKVLEITLVDFLILEDLFSKIKEEHDLSEDKEAEKRRYYDTEILYITDLFLRFCPMTESKLTRPGLENFRDLILKLGMTTKIFKFSDERTYRSRIQTYHPGKFLEITVVVPLTRRDKDRSSKRYSSYCKGHPTPGRRGEAPLPYYLQKELGENPDFRPEILIVNLEVNWKALTSS